MNIQAGARCVAPTKTRLVRLVANRLQLDLDAIGFEDDGGAADRQFADAAAAKAAADREPFGIAPRLEFVKAPDHQRKVLGKIFDGTMHQTGFLDIAASQKHIELLLGQLLARLIAQRIIAGFAQRLAPILDDLPERALTGAVADKTLVVFDFDIVAVEVDLRQPAGAMRRDLRRGDSLFGHPRFPNESSKNRASTN